MATHSSVLAWEIPWTEEPNRLQSMGSKESDTTERLHFTFVSIIITSVPLQRIRQKIPEVGDPWIRPAL